MEKIRQVLRCYSQGYGTKSISSMLTVSRNTVKKYLQVFQRSGLDYEGDCPYRTRNSRSYSTKRPE
ncbi:helix-turn-helix domain-containing protein [Bacteroides fragilis]|uniref:helix-turn-helix domain-containing protein n=1 Tax=Bacteroides fragilis TaxID=817 RepID=UPI00202FFEBD|nr:helix-turn-helix domain-containing protein [Bacteroides fragilis]